MNLEQYNFESLFKQIKILKICLNELFFIKKRALDALILNNEFLVFLLG